MKNGIDTMKSLIYLTLFILFFKLVFYLQDRDIKSLEENGIYTIGEVIDFGRKRSAIWTYCNGEKKIRVSSRKKIGFIGLQKGETFKAVYDPAYSKNTKLLFEYPIYDKEKFYILQKYRIISYNRDNVIYEYKSSNKWIKRQQMFPEIEEWRESDSYNLLVKIDNSKIAYLIHNKN